MDFLSVAFSYSSLSNITIVQILIRARQTNNSYKPPTKHEMGGRLLEANTDAYQGKSLGDLKKKAPIFGLCLYGDGATIVRSPLINILASSPDNPQCVLDVVDCSSHCSKGKKKDAHFIAQTALKCMKQVDREKELFDLVIFDGASNMQKGAELIAQHFPRVSTAVGTEHVVSNYIGKIAERILTGVAPVYVR